MTGYPRDPHAQLAPHFRRFELQCRCCAALQLDPILLVVLEWLRAAGGDQPLQVNSGYRCPTHNETVGGVPNSTHTRGLAADLRHVDFAELIHFGIQLPYITGIIFHAAQDPAKRFLHLDVGNPVKRIFGYVDDAQTTLSGALQAHQQMEGA